MRRLDDHFVAALPLVTQTLADILKPPPAFTPSRWAAENFVVPDGPRSGEKWDMRLTPYVPAIIDELGPDAPANWVVVRKSAQTGISIAALAWLGSMIDHAPARMAYVLPTIDALRDFNGEKLTPAIDHSKVLAAKVKKQASRSGEGSTAHTKRFPGGSLLMINAGSAAALRSKTIKYGVADEVDEWDKDLDGQGDPFSLLEARFIAFHATADWKLFELSTPTLVGETRIDPHYKAGDQRKWHMPCPGCGENIVFAFEHLKFNRKPPYQAHYVAPCCGTIIEHHEKAELVRAGRFIATNDEGLHPSFHIDALISLLTTWDKVAEQWWKSFGDPTQEKVFYNTWLGRPYELKGDAPDHERLMERREDYAENRIPPLGLILTAGADVQHSGIWLEIVAWAPDKQSWVLSARFLEGDTTDPNKGAFLKLLEAYDQEFPDAFGEKRQIDAMAVDAGDGGRSNAVYGFCRSRARAFAIHGLPGWTRPAISSPLSTTIATVSKAKCVQCSKMPVFPRSRSSHFMGTNISRASQASAKLITCVAVLLPNTIGVFCPPMRLLWSASNIQGLWYNQERFDTRASDSLLAWRFISARLFGRSV